MGDLPSPPPPFRWTRVWLSCNRSTAPQWVTPRGVRLRFGPIAGPHPGHPSTPREIVLQPGHSASGPHRRKCGYGSDLPEGRRTPMRDKNVRRANGEGKYPWGLVILVTNQGAPTRAGGRSHFILRWSGFICLKHRPGFWAPFGR